MCFGPQCVQELPPLLTNSSLFSSPTYTSMFIPTCTEGQNSFHLVESPNSPFRNFISLLHHHCALPQAFPYTPFPKYAGGIGNPTSLFLVFEVPPVALGGVIATVGHGFLKSRLDPMHCSELAKQEWKALSSQLKEKTQGKCLKIGILKLTLYIHFCSGKGTWSIWVWTENVISLIGSHKVLLECFFKLTEKNLQKTNNLQEQKESK